MGGEATSDSNRARLTRRTLLTLLGGGALLAACGGQASPPSPTTGTAPAGGTTVAAPSPTAGSASAMASPTPAVGATRTAAAVGTRATITGTARAATTSPAGATGGTAAAIVIPDSGARIPSENLTVRWLDNGDQKGEFFKQLFAAYNKKYPNVTIDYSPLPGPEIAKVVPLGVQSGTAPDVFMNVSPFTTAEVVRSSWVQPLDDIVPGFAEWKKGFPFGAFLPGVSDFGGKTYFTAFAGNRRQGNLLLHNTAYLQAAGYDPAAKTLTWEEFRAAAKKITEAGKGQYFGLILGGNTAAPWAGTVTALATMAGAAGGEINWKTGEYNYAGEPFAAAVELLLAIKSDGSFFPGSVSINAPQARAQMPNGAVGMILQGPWNIAIWGRENPNFKFGVSSPPLRDPANFTPISVGPGGANYYGVFAKSKFPTIAGDLIRYAGSAEGQRAWAAIVGVSDPPIQFAALEAVDLPALERKAADIARQQVRIEPSPAARNPDVSLVNLELKPIKPDLGETVQGLFTGQLRDTRAALKDLQDRAEAELARAIKAAQAKGAKVSRDDWKFPNWDPQKDYTQEFYDAL